MASPVKEARVAGRSFEEPLIGAQPAPEGRRPSWRRWLGMGGALALVVALLVLVALQMANVKRGRAGEGDVAPNFTLQAFDGQHIELASLRGQVVVVNFWASWCKPCEAEAADLENAWRHYKDQGVMFLGVDYVDTNTEALAYLDRFDVTYPNGPDLQTRISQAYRVKGVPETFVIDQAGVVQRVFVGPTTQLALSAVIDQLLAGQ